MSSSFHHNEICTFSIQSSVLEGLRYKYGIEGTLCKDILVSSYCMWCNWCQMKREMEYRQTNPSAVNMQPCPVETAHAVQPSAPAMRPTGSHTIGCSFTIVQPPVQSGSCLLANQCRQALITCTCFVSRGGGLCLPVCGLCGAVAFCCVMP